MAVRELAGAGSDNIVVSPGALSGMTSGTIAVLVKRTAATSGDSFFVTHDSGGSLGIYIQWTQFGDLEYGQNFNAVSVGGQGSTGVWRLIVVRKASGSATPRFSVYDYSNTTWTHSDANGTNGDPGAPGAGGTIDFNAAGNYPDTRVAVRAAWSNTVKWAADSTGDAAVQAAGLHTALSNWVTAAPSALWSYNQASTATAVTDLTAGGADQTSITGTTVVTGDDPAGFDFSLAGSVSGTAAAPLGGLAAAATGTRKVLATAAGSLGALTAAATGTRKVLGAAAAPLGGLTATATGTRKAIATAAGSLGALTGSATGTPTVLGTAAASLGALTASATSGHTVHGTAAAALGGLRGVAVATGAATPAVRYRASGPSRNTRWAAHSPTRPDRWHVGALPLTDVFTSIYATAYGRH